MGWGKRGSKAESQIVLICELLLLSEIPHHVGTETPDTNSHNVK